MSAIQRDGNSILRILITAMLLAPSVGMPQDRAHASFQNGTFKWELAAPVFVPTERPDDPCHAVKDPTILRFEDRWHLFCTIRSQKRTHQIEYASFKDWADANTAQRHVLTVSTGYFCAPQVFYFRPHSKWYLLYQANEPSRKPSLQPVFSTSTNIANPSSWSSPVLLFKKHPDNVKMWIDFWIICDDGRAHLFFTSLDGKMWRAETKLADFPFGWNDPVVVLEDDIFEASHTYRVKGLNKFLTIVEAQADGRRYYKAYIAERLDGKWQALSGTRERPFASSVNVRHLSNRWTDSYSHGELLRAGHDERLEVEPQNLTFLFQGVSDQQKAGKAYGAIPWQLGLLRASQP